MKLIPNPANKSLQDRVLANVPAPKEPVPEPLPMPDGVKPVNKPKQK